MDELLRQLITILRGMWHRRWLGLAVAWLIGVVGAVEPLATHQDLQLRARLHGELASHAGPQAADGPEQPAGVVGALAVERYPRPRIVAGPRPLEALAQIDAIAAVAGIDALFIGRIDLTVSMGCTDPADPKVMGAVEAIDEGVE